MNVILMDAERVPLRFEERENRYQTVANLSAIIYLTASVKTDKINKLV
jgi:hypothetical protein